MEGIKENQALEFIDFSERISSSFLVFSFFLFFFSLCKNKTDRERRGKGIKEG